MSQQLISRNPDLKGLRDAGYDVSIKGAYLVIADIPYVNAKREVLRGILVSDLTLIGDKTDAAQNHVAYFSGECPCDKSGAELSKLINERSLRVIAENLSTQFSFSAKRASSTGMVSYPDYFCKMTTYIDILSAPAESIESGVSAKTFPVFETTEDESVFMYLDTASSRAGISMIGKKLEPLKIAIIGLGGTGSYVLDLVAKTGVSEIHLYDADKFSSHNAFRSPGAPSLVELRCGRAKVSFFAEKYSNIRRKIFAHDVFIESSNADELREMDFVFLCLDMGSAKSPILKKLKDFSIPFVDVGMGIYAENGALGGTLRVTTYSSAKGDHLDKRISLGDPEGEGAYEQSIQIAELNALNACLAVIKWKKLFKFYLDFENEHHSTYTLDGNVLTNEELA